MLLPVRDVSLPSALVGQPNGQLPASLLVSTAGQGGGPLVRMDATATRAFRALSAAALEAGHVLKATSAVDSYRPYSVQYDTFHARYTTTPIAGAPTRTCAGIRYYQRPGTAMAACPGTSNHGLGLAIDLAGVDAYLPWLVAHELAYGFSHEVPSEAWHIRYFTGDAIPAAVLAYEARNEDDMTPEQAAQLSACQTILDGLARGLDEVWITVAPYPDKDGKLSLAPFWDKLATEVVARLPAGGGSAGANITLTFPETQITGTATP